MSNNTMVYLAVDRDGTESIFDSEPQRGNDGYWQCIDWAGTFIELPKGTIKKLTGKDLTFEMGYVSYVSDDYDPTPE